MNYVTRFKQGNKAVLYWYTDAAAGSKDIIKSHDVSITGTKEEVKRSPYDSLKGVIKLQTEIKTHSFWVRRGGIKLTPYLTPVTFNLPPFMQVQMTFNDALMAFPPSRNAE